MGDSKRQSLGRWGNGSTSAQHQAEDPYDTKRELLAANQHSGGQERNGTNPTMPKKPGTGFEAFLERGLAQAGARAGGGGDHKSGAVFQKGPLKGLDRGQAIEKMRDMYANLDDSVRAKYEDRANLRDVRSDRDNAAGAQYDKDVADYVSGGSSSQAERTIENGGLVPVMTNGPGGRSAVRYVPSGAPEQAQAAPIFTRSGGDPDVARMGAMAATPTNPALPGQESQPIDAMASAAQTAAGNIGDVGPEIGPPTEEQANNRLNEEIQTSLAEIDQRAIEALKPKPSINGQPIPERGEALTKYDKASGKMVPESHKPDETGMDIKRNFPGHDQLGGGGKGGPPMPEFTDANGNLQNAQPEAFDFKKFAAAQGLDPAQIKSIQTEARQNVRGTAPQQQPAAAGTAVGGQPSSGYGNQPNPTAAPPVNRKQAAAPPPLPLIDKAQAQV